jgi:hypothetical protein
MLLEAFYGFFDCSDEIRQIAASARTGSADYHRTDDGGGFGIEYSDAEFLLSGLAWLTERVFTHDQGFDAVYLLKLGAGAVFESASQEILLADDALYPLPLDKRRVPRAEDANELSHEYLLLLRIESEDGVSLAHSQLGPGEQRVSHPARIAAAYRQHQKNHYSRNGFQSEISHHFQALEYQKQVFSHISPKLCISDTTGENLEASHRIGGGKMQVVAENRRKNVI